MPNIEQFDAKGTITPTNIGVEAEAQAGRRIGMFYNQMGQDIGRDVTVAGDAYKAHQETMEVTQLYKTGTDMQNGLQQAWQAYTADPANAGRTDLAASFMADHVKPVIDQWSSHAQTDKGKEIAAEMGARTTDELFCRTLGDQSSLDAEHAHENLQGTVNNFSAQVVQDPTSYDRVMGDQHTAIDAMTNSIGDVSQRETVRREMYEQADKQTTLGLYHSVAATAEEKIAAGDPTGATALAYGRQLIASQKGAEFIGGEGMASMTDLMDQAEQRGQQRFKANEAFQRQGIEDDGRGQYVQISNGINEAIRAGKVAPPDLLQAASAWAVKYGKYLPSENGQLQGMLDRSITDANANTFQANDPRTVSRMDKQILIPQGQPGAITRAQIDKAYFEDKTISKSQHDQYITQQEHAANDKDYADGLKNLNSWLSLSIRPQLTRSTPENPDGTPNILASSTVDPKGDIAYAEALRESHDIYDANIKAGMTPAQAIDRMTNPTSGHSLMERMDYWKHGAAAPDPTTYFSYNPRATQEGQNPQPGPPPPAGSAASLVVRPGESTADYLKRVGG